MAVFNIQTLPISYQNYYCSLKKRNFGTVWYGLILSPFSNPCKFLILHRYTLHKTRFKIFKSTRHYINYIRWYLYCKGKTSSHNINYIQIDLKADLVFSFTNQNQLIYLQIHIIIIFYLFRLSVSWYFSTLFSKRITLSTYAAATVNGCENLMVNEESLIHL